MTDGVEGAWLEDDLRRAFVAGALWWHYRKTGFTAWPTERGDAEVEAERRYPDGRCINSDAREGVPALLAEIARLRAEVKDHAEWAKEMARDPASALYRKMQSDNDLLRSEIARLRALVPPTTLDDEG